MQSYNPENHISKIEKVSGTCALPGTVNESWSFFYDGDGIRVKEVYTDGTSTLTKYYFAGGMYEVQDDGTTQTTKKYYFIAGMRVAMDDGTDLVYFATDHLSSTSIVMSDTGTLLSEQRYLPFGGVRGDVGTLITETDFDYTGQRDLGGMGLMDYNARFYSPLLGRFVQPDTIVSNPGDSQAWNRYSYTSNNPIRFVDPTGHYLCKGADAAECDVKDDPFISPPDVEVRGDVRGQGPTDDYQHENEKLKEKKRLEELEREELIRRARHFNCPSYVPLENCARTNTWEYITFALSYNEPIVKESKQGMGMTLSFTIDRHGNVYHTMNASTGAFPSIRLTFGDVPNADYFDPNYEKIIKDFILGTDELACAGYVVGACATNLDDNTGWEAGLMTPTMELNWIILDEDDIPIP